MGFDPDPRHLNAGFLLIRYGGTRYDPTARTADRAVRVERGRFLAVIRSPAKRRRGKPRGRHPHKRLSVAFVRSAPPGRHCDGNGLYLYVQKTGTRSWIQRLVIRGRKRELGRLAEKRRSAGIPTFAETAKRVIEQKRAGWRNAAVPRNWYRSFEIHVFPRIGRVPVSEVTSADVLEILTSIWHTKPPTARIVRHRIRAVMEWAIAMDWRTDNPCDRLLPVLGSQQHVVRHRKALPHREVGGGDREGAGGEGGQGGRAGVRVHGAHGGAGRRGPRGGMERDRPGGACLDGPREPDEEPARAPGAAVRAGAGDSRRGAEAGWRRESDRVRRQARQSDGRRADGPATQEARIVAVPHGFRSSFRDWAAEETDHPREVVEAALAHVVRNPVEAAYMRSDLFERRRRLMVDWAAYLAGDR